MNANVIELAQLLTSKKLTIATAESCTSGNLAATITSVAGSSKYFDRGYITYSNKSKIDMLNVSAETLNNFGAVSSEVAKEMVSNVVNKANSDIGVAITGIAGPSGGSVQKPVGTVYFGFYICGDYHIKVMNFNGNRASIVAQSVDFSIDFLLKIIA